MDAYIAWDGDGVFCAAERLERADDEEGLRRAGRDAERGNAAVLAWVADHGGSSIAVGGDRGHARVPADALDDLPAARDRYEQVVGAPLSVGVGVRLSHAGLALRAAKMRGGDRVVFFTPEVAEELDEARRGGEDEEFRKAEPPPPPEPESTAPPGSPAAGGGFVERPQPGAGGAGAASPSPGQFDGGLVEQEDGGADPGPTSAEAEDQFHQLAQAGAQQDDAAAQAQGDLDATKRRVVELLQQAKQQAPKFEAIRQADPELYEVFQGIIASLVLTAQALVAQGGQSAQQQQAPVSKAELPLPENGPTKHILNLPVGASRRGKVKVRHGDNRTTWVSVRAGQVLSADDAHPISARNPGGR